MSRGLAKRLITADEYERMGEAGVFPPDARLELIEGEIYEMSPIGSLHAARVTFLTRVAEKLGGGFQVRVQNPSRLNDISEPQPDLALVRWRDDYYRGAHPRPDDVLLAVEVADSTVNADPTSKIPLYARARIPEAWLVNIPEEQVEIYSAPARGLYQRAEVFGRGAEAKSHTVEGLAVGVSQLLG